MHEFDRDILLTEQEPLLFTGRVTGNWSINGNPHGGYLTAILANAMSRCSEKTATPVITVNFVSRSVPGEAEVLVERISRSNQFDRLGAKLVQEGREKIRAFGTFVKGDEESPEKHYEKSPPEIPRVEDCTVMPAMPGYTLFDQMDVLLDPACAGWLSGRVADKSEIRGWVKFREDRSFDFSSILLIADCFPPPILVSHGMVSWVPTIEYSVSVRSLPKSRWLKGVFHTSFVNNGILEEDGEIWDESGDIVAISRQIAQYRKIGG